ncbi:hypothetical protein C8R45DRAFT_908478 [Mycena sanguinolenta]|nr:hypothetical protein C8R45DRAFT_908478 [Mycena sanguinolenta]
MANHPEHPQRTLCDKVKGGVRKLSAKLKAIFHKFVPKLPVSVPLPPSRSTAPALAPIVPEDDSTPVPSPDSSKEAEVFMLSKPEPDWEGWNIDGDAISDLRAWGDRGGSNWTKLAEKIYDALESTTLEIFQEFIPDGPFPVKSLVKALLSIVQLGIKAPIMKRRAYEFAQEVIEYITILLEAANGDLGVRKELEKIRRVVNEVCEWANQQVRKKTAPSEADLGEWQSKFAKAKEMFMAVTLLRLRVEQADTRRLGFIKEKLANHVATKHEYTDQRKSICANNTRVAIQEELERWLLPEPTNRERIFWITGIPGSGKSTLSATLVDNLRKKHTPVAAHFFISRNIPDTIHPNKLVPTIVKQLAEFSPAAARVIYDALKKDGFPSSSEEQIKSLLLPTIRELCKSCDVVIILIDALDELQNATHSVLEILLPLARRAADFPENVRFVLTSRPESWAWIENVSKTLDIAVFKPYSLRTKSSRGEVHDFIVARMTDITPKDWEGWPNAAQLLEFSRRADGLFHYAATALQWIQNQIEKHNKSCQAWVFDRLLQKGLGQLEHLYRVILTSFESTDLLADALPEDVQMHEDRLCGFRHVFGAVLVLYRPLTIDEIAALLADIPVAQLDVKHFLEQFRSVLMPGTSESFEQARPQVHKTFRDYVMNTNAPTGFQILAGHAHFMTARSCLEVIVKGERSSDIHSKYAVLYWPEHLRRAVEEGTTCEDERIWKLFGQMMEDRVVDFWVPGTRENSLRFFVNLAVAGWRLLEVRSRQEKTPNE